MTSNATIDSTTVFFFFFQAEDGIRDLTVTGVQTCALPISGIRPALPPRPSHPGGSGRFRSRKDEHRSEEHTSKLQSQSNLVCGLVLDKTTPDHRSPTPSYAATQALTATGGFQTTSSPSMLP